MIQLLATAAVLSCGEAQNLVNRIDSTQFSRKEYYEIVDVVRDNARRRCNITAHPTLFRRQVRNLRDRIYVSRPIWRAPQVHVPAWGSPTLIFRF